MIATWDPELFVSFPYSHSLTVRDITSVHAVCSIESEKFPLRITNTVEMSPCYTSRIWL